MAHPYTNYLSKIRSSESGGNDKARNPHGASGRYQFLPSTWTNMGYNVKDIYNPQLQEEAAYKLTKQNADFLKRKLGIQPTDADLYGSHFLGAYGYTKLYKAQDSAPISTVMSNIEIAHNPFLKGKTVGYLKNWLSKKMGQPAVNYGDSSPDSDSGPGFLPAKFDYNDLQFMMYDNYNALTPEQRAEFNRYTSSAESESTEDVEAVEAKNELAQKEREKNFLDELNSQYEEAQQQPQSTNQQQAPVDNSVYSMPQIELPQYQAPQMPEYEEGGEERGPLRVSPESRAMGDVGIRFGNNIHTSLGANLQDKNLRAGLSYGKNKLATDINYTRGFDNTSSFSGSASYNPGKYNIDFSYGQEPEGNSNLSLGAGYRGDKLSGNLEYSQNNQDRNLSGNVRYGTGNLSGSLGTNFVLGQDFNPNIKGNINYQNKNFTTSIGAGYNADMGIQPNISAAYRFQEGGEADLPQYQNAGFSVEGKKPFTAPIVYNNNKQNGYTTKRDSVAHQADKILEYEQLRGGPGGAPLPEYADPVYRKVLMNSIYPQVQKIMPKASAMEIGEAMDFIFNAGWDKDKNKITKDPRAFALQEYYKQYDPSKLDKDGTWAGRKNAPYSFDQEYNNTIGKLPENQRRILMNRGRDWYYQNTAPKGSTWDLKTQGPHPNYSSTWYGRIHNTNDYKPFNPNNPKFTKKEDGGYYQDGGLKFLQPTDPKLPIGGFPKLNLSSEKAISIGGENGEPAYLIPSFKYGQPLDDPLGEFRKTGEHLGGPFKTWQEADKWENETRHPAVEKGENIMFPQEQFQKGGKKEPITTREDFEPGILSNVPGLTSLASGNQPGYNRQEQYGPLGDLYRYYGGQPLEHGVLVESQNKPSTSKDKNAKYISLNHDREFVNEVLDNYERISSGKLDKGESKIGDNSWQVSGYSSAGKDAHKTTKQGSEHHSNAIGRYILGKGKDEKGEYISYYDKFDQGTGLGINPGELVGLTKPFEIYDRIYLKDVNREFKDGGSIPERYRNMGFTRVGAKRQSTRPGKKWMVLAKKGSDYKIVHGGYDGMKDFSQHGSKDRKKRFWDRMGGRDSAKANDPFSPLYWHKRFGTWAEGGYFTDKDEKTFSELKDAYPSDTLVDILTYMSNGGVYGLPTYQEGGTQEGNPVKIVTLQDADGTMRKVRTDSQEYADLYKSGNLQSGDISENADRETWFGGEINQINLVGKGKKKTVLTPAGVVSSGKFPSLESQGIFAKNNIQDIQTKLRGEADQALAVRETIPTFTDIKTEKQINLGVTNAKDTLGGKTPEQVLAEIQAKNKAKTKNKQDFKFDIANITEDDYNNLSQDQKDIINSQLRKNNLITPLSPGSTKDQIKATQKLLVDKGYDLGDYGVDKNGVDGIYGPKTTKALSDYNKKVDSEQGYNLIKKYNQENFLKSTPDNPNFFYINSDEGIKDVQTTYQQMGFLNPNLKNFDLNFSGENLKTSPRVFSNSFIKAYDKDVCEYGKECATFVTNDVLNSMNSIFGGSAKQKFDESNVRGDAWTMDKNITDAGGKTLYSVFGETKPRLEQTTKAVKGYIQDRLKSRPKIDTSTLKEGDIVSMYYDKSPNFVKAYNESSRTFTTHIGILKRDKNNNLYVEHNVHGKIFRNPISEALKGTTAGNSKIQISAITRPTYNLESSNITVDTQLTSSNQGVNYDKVKNPNSPFVRGNLPVFQEAITRNKKVILKDVPINEREFNNLEKAATSIAWNESYGNEKIDKPNLVSLQGAKKLIGTAADNLGVYELSRGFTQIKDQKNLNNNLRNRILPNDSDLSDPKKSAIASFYSLASKYLYLRDLSKKNNIKISDSDLTKLTMLSWNENIKVVGDSIIKYRNYDDIITRYRTDEETNKVVGHPYDKVIGFFENNFRIQ